MLAEVSAWFAYWFGRKPLVLPRADLVTERRDDVPLRRGGRAAGAAAAWGDGDDLEWAAAIARAKAVADTVRMLPEATAIARAKAVADTVTPPPEATAPPALRAFVPPAPLASLRAVPAVPRQPLLPPRARASVVASPLRAAGGRPVGPRVRA